MKTSFTQIFCVLTFLLFASHLSAEKYTAIASGNWSSGSVWDRGVAPSLTTDTVIIDGYAITLNNSTGNVAISSLSITNASGEVGSLVIDANLTLTVLFDVTVTAENEEKDVELQLKQGAILDIRGDITFTRVTANTKEEKLLLNLKNTSQVTVTGDFIFDYKNGSSNESSNEILLENSTQLDVSGSMYLYMRGKENFNFKIQSNALVTIGGNLEALKTGGKSMTIEAKDNAHLQVGGNTQITNSGGSNKVKLWANGSHGKVTLGGNLTIESTATDEIAFMEATKSNCEINVAGDITLIAQSEGDVHIELKDASDMYFGGSFFRPTNYGSLIMSSGATLTFNGMNAQTLPEKDLPGSGADNFNLTNIVLNNSTGFVLADSLFVENVFQLSSGNVITTSGSPLVIEDQAVISGGNENAYIEGPVVKRGRSNGTAFVFPIGISGKYAPLEVSELTSSSTEITAEYFGDPPPFGDFLESGIDNISGNGYWNVTKTTGSEDPNISLHWADAAAEGISELNDLLVVGLNASNEWESFGNGGTTGGTGAGVSGSVSNLMGDPPPFGIEYLTIGSASPENALPVELTMFYAIQENNFTYLRWQTAVEIDFDHFIIERSKDGYSYSSIAIVGSQGKENGVQNYATKDELPFAGMNYYRLKMVNSDSSFEYSNIEVVDFETESKYVIYPNPVDQKIELQSAEPNDEKITFDVFNKVGQKIYSGEFQLENGNIRTSAAQINVHEAGVYFLFLKGKKRNHILKLIKL